MKQIFKLKTLYQQPGEGIALQVTELSHLFSIL